MLFLVQNNHLVKDREKTYLTASVAVAGTSLTVRSVDSNAWADDDWVIVGELGSSNAEILQINGAVSDGTSLTVDNAGSGGARYAHSAGEPVYRIDYNQVKIYRATTETGSKALLSTVEIQPDDIETRYEDSSNTTGFGFVTFYNSDSTLESTYSDAIPYAGRSDKSLAYMAQRVRKGILESVSDNYVEDDEIIDTINEIQTDILNEWLWSFNEIERSMSRVANQFAYDVDSEIKTVYSVRADSTPLKYVSQNVWERLHWDSDTSSDEQTVFSVWNNQIKLHPRIASAAVTTTLDGNVASGDTTITVDDTSSFERGDYYRFQINSEVIYATGSTSTTFTGCLRAQEGTTAAAHTDADTVTELDIVVAGQAEPVDMDTQNDTTVVPEPRVIINGAIAELAHTKLQDHALGDRYDIKYERGLTKLKDKFGMKQIGQFSRVKDARELPMRGNYRNPNDYPTNVSDI